MRSREVAVVAALAFVFFGAANLYAAESRGSSDVEMPCHGGAGMTGDRMMPAGVTPAGSAPANVELSRYQKELARETAGLRSEIEARRLELAQLWQVEKPDQEKIVAKMREVSRLNLQLQEKAVAYRFDLGSAVLGPLRPWFRSYGRHMGAMGGQMGMMGKTGQPGGCCAGD